MDDEIDDERIFGEVALSRQNRFYQRDKSILEEINCVSKINKNLISFMI